MVSILVNIMGHLTVDIMVNSMVKIIIITVNNGYWEYCQLS